MLDGLAFGCVWADRKGARAVAKKPVCLVCEKEMVKGTMISAGDGLPRWWEGEPRRDGAAGAGGSRDGFVVVAFRCPACEALRLYAPSEGA